MLDGYYPISLDQKIAENASKKDNIQNIYSLEVTDIFPSHDGCVNTIKWDRSGQFILSGGDDRCVSITDAFSNGSDNVVYRKELKAMSNIFVAKFFPQASDNMIYAGFRCGCVVRVSVNGGGSLSDGQLFCSHRNPVYDILLPQDQPHCLLTLSHDHTVLLWDTRLPHIVGRDMSTCGRACFSGALSTVPSAFSKLCQVAPALRFKVPVTAGDVHPLDGSRAIALASADGFVRLFDLRRLFSHSMSSKSDQTVPSPYQVVRPLGLDRANIVPAMLLDYGSMFITSVLFEPQHLPHPNLSLHRPVGKHWRYKAQYPGRRLLVSHMYSSAFLFDLNQLENRRDEDFKVQAAEEALGESDYFEQLAQAQPPPLEEDTERMRVNAERFSRLFFAMLLARAAERRSAMGVTRPRVGTESPSHGTPTSVTSQTRHTSSGVAGTSAADEVVTSPPASPGEVEVAPEEDVASALGSSPRARQLAAYSGQRSWRTVIKDACFWGEKCIMSGSECGRVLVWDRETTQPVTSIPADDTVVNRLQPHPFLPYLAVSGVDHSIKLLKPTPAPADETEEEFAERVEKLRQEAFSTMRMNVARTRYLLENSSSVRQRIPMLLRVPSPRSRMNEAVDPQETSSENNTGADENDSDNSVTQ